MRRSGTSYICPGKGKQADAKSSNLEALGAESQRERLWIGLRSSTIVQQELAVVSIDPDQSTGDRSRCLDWR